MKISRSDIEITTPVGSFESLAAAVQAKAGSVYFGVGELNMRSRSSVNFTVNDLPEIISICKKNGIRSYITLNTVVFDYDLEYVESIIKEIKEHGADAVIASDMAVIQIASKYNIEVHISTQANISNTQAVKTFAKYADVMVLARELNLEQVKVISDNIIKENIAGPSGNPVRLEMFVHGALCMSVSGKCYLSLHERNLSANRGGCLQMCRRAYLVQDKETGRELEIDNEYIMSPKDLCTINFLDKIISAGVSVLKIEGRARAPEYVKTVTECYKEAVDSIFQNNYTKEKIKKWEQRLSAVFNRGFWDGYYLGKTLGEWSDEYGSVATKKKEYTAKVTNYFTKIGVAELLCETGELNKGDEILIVGPTTGVIETYIDEMQIERKTSEKVVKGQYFSIPSATTLRRSDKLYKIVNR